MKRTLVESQRRKFLPLQSYSLEKKGCSNLLDTLVGDNQVRSIRCVDETGKAYPRKIKLTQTGRVNEVVRGGWFALVGSGAAVPCVVATTNCRTSELYGEMLQI